MRWLYDIFFLIFAVLYFPYVILRGKWHGGFRQRFGWFRKKDFARALAGETVWVHAVSVGEVQAVVRLIHEIRGLAPGSRIVVTTVTVTGHRLARRLLGDEADILFAPLDASPIVRGFIRRLRPLVYLTAETELWPNLLAALRGAGIPAVLVNGRLSDSSFGRYRRVRALFRPALSAFAMAGVQSDEDGRRFVEIGLPPEKIRVTGNLKFDDAPDPADGGAGVPVFPEGMRVWIAGSTHAGEERIVLSVLQRLRPEFPELRLILVPRHVERCPQIAALILGRGLRPHLYSALRPPVVDVDAVVLVDSVGHLRPLYRQAALAFIGKSLTARGGQNPIEPAALGVPVVMGPRMDNFRGVAGLFLREGAALEVRDADSLEAAVRRILTDDHLRESMGRAGRRIVSANQGAMAKTKSMLRPYLPAATSAG